MESKQLLKGACHCGAVKFTARHKPDELRDCNCSLCRRLGERWAYYPLSDVTISGPTQNYIQGERTLAVHRCVTCGCVMAWLPLPAKDDGGPYHLMAINTRMCDPAELADIPVHLLDNAGAWEILDPD